MDAALITAIGAMLAAPVAAAAAIYGTRGANRAAREGGALTGYSTLTDQLQEERDDMRAQLTQLRTDLAAERAESARLRLIITRMGGTP
ncbi:hypothetical protein [Streptomyces omiyaensis]|uniref:hypothetical protein n=1 Tax=Streptomyces omiyaensis TaxID=68247 RepID=UPI0036FF8021